MTIARILRPRYTLSRQRILNSFYRSYSSEGDAVSTGIWDALIWLRFVVAKEFGSVQSNVLNENVQSFASISWEYALQSSALWPSNLLERTLELIHIGTGTSWGATIILYSVGLRAILFPFSLMQTRSAITANNLKPQVQKMQADAQQLKAQGRVEESHQKLRQLTKFMSVKNISPIRILGLSLFPLPFFMSTFFALRNMAHLPLESFSLEHFLWLQNLTLADPYYILPAASTALLLLSMELSKYSSPNNNMSPGLKIGLRVFGAASFPVLSYMPSALVLYFCTSNLITCVVQAMWASRRLRKLFRIPELIVTDKLPAPKMSFFETFTETYRSHLREPSSSLPNQKLPIIYSQKPSRPT